MAINFQQQQKKNFAGGKKKPGGTFLKRYITGARKAPRVTRRKSPA